MIVQIIIITIGFVIALSYPTGIEPLWSLPTDLPNTLMSASAILLLSILYILIGIRLVRHQIRNNLTHYYRQLFNYRLLLLLVYFVNVYVFHLPILITGSSGFIGLGIGEIPFVTNFLILLPFFLTLILSYIPFYQVERFIYRHQSDRQKSDPVRDRSPNAFGDRKLATSTFALPDDETKEKVSDRGDCISNGADKFPSLLNYLSFQIRTYFLLAVLPLLFFIFALDIIHAIRPLRDMVITYPFTEWLASILLLLTMYILTPFVLKYLWVTKPLPEGSLRIFLKSIGYRANIKIRDFLIWEVGQRPFVNALIIGLFPFNRFVIFTDSLINNLSDDEIAAVFAHEVGHAKFNHLLLLMLFAFAYLSILFSLSGVIDNALGEGIWNLTVSLSLIMVFWLVLFGQLSRRFELQADWFAAEITADPDSFTRALTKIAYLNGIPMRTSGLSSLTHPSIEKRITSIGNKDIFALAQLKTMKKIITILVISCALGLGGVGYTIITEINSAPQRQLKIQAFDMTQKAYSLLAELEKETNYAVQLEKLKMSIFYINSAIALDPQRPFNYIIKGDAFRYLGPKYNKESQLNYRKAYELEPTDPAERYYLSRKLSGQ